jgi:hypothetical protein
MTAARYAHFSEWMQKPSVEEKKIRIIRQQYYFSGDGHE